MATFLDLLRTSIREAASTREASFVRPEAPPEIVTFARGQVYRLLRELERAAEAHRPPVGEQPGFRFWRATRSLERAHSEWTTAGALERFVQAVYPEICAGIGAGASRSEMERLFTASIQWAVVGGAPSLSVLEIAELKRVVAMGREAMEQGGTANVRSYAHEVGLLRSRDGSLTAAGGVFLDLAGAEAVEWLLHLELLRSTGWSDPWRICRDAASVLAQRPRRIAPAFAWGEEDSPRRPATAALRRLADLALLTFVEDEVDDDGDVVWGWDLLPFGKEVLAAVLADPPRPLRALAHAAMDDDLMSVVGGPTHVGGTSAQATIDFSRAVAHEIRNALGPLRGAVNLVVGRADPHLTPAEREAVGRIERGFRRLEDFAGEVTKLGRHGASVGPIDVAHAIEAALRATETERNGKLRVVRNLRDATVWGNNDRFVLALANLVRNAAQAAPATGALLTVEVTVLDQRVQIRFADSGPGVPPEHAARIFEAGFSTRGGSGLGLHIVRTIVADEMQGEVTFSPGGSGGATFTLSLPSRGERT